MIYRLYKLVFWLKTNWQPIAGILATVLLIYASCQTKRAGHWQKEHLRLEGKLEEQKSDQDQLWAEAERLRIERVRERDEERKKREQLEARIKRVIAEGKKAKQELEREKKKTAALPATELVAEINERIGNESELTDFSLFPFRFTRTGVNRTLDRFKDGEFYLSEYNKFQGVLEDHKAEVESFNKSIGECDKEKIGNFDGWKDCRETLSTALDDIEALEKAKSAVVWKGRLQGAVGGSIATIVVCKILGVF